MYNLTEKALEAIAVCDFVGYAEVIMEYAKNYQTGANPDLAQLIENMNMIMSTCL